MLNALNERRRGADTLPRINRETLLQESGQIGRNLRIERPDRDRPLPLSLEQKRGGFLLRQMRWQGPERCLARQDLVERGGQAEQIGPDVD